jgi:hypothetical protein
MEWGPKRLTRPFVSFAEFALAFGSRFVHARAPECGWRVVSANAIAHGRTFSEATLEL